MFNKKTSVNLKNFYWYGLISRTGKRVSGKIQAENETEVKTLLLKQNIRIRKIKKRNISSFEKIKYRIKRKDITAFTRQLSTILSAGVPIIQALQLMIKSTSKYELQIILEQICLSLQNGDSLSNAFSSHNKFFNPFYIQLIKVGEETGNLPLTFQRLAYYQEKNAQLRAKVIKATIYPTIIALTAIIVTILMLTLVIPKFKELFNSFGSTLPWLTQQVINLSNLLLQYGGYFSLFLIFCLITLYLQIQKSYQLRLNIDRYILYLPVLGNIITKASIAKFTHALATSFSSGITLLDALQLTQKTVDNLYYRTMISSVQRQLSEGESFYLAMYNTHAFPELALQMITIGEESGKLDEMLTKISMIYEEDVDNTMNNLGALLEPFIILFLGIMIGSLIIAMYLPIFDIMNMVN